MVGRSAACAHRSYDGLAEAVKGGFVLTFAEVGFIFLYVSPVLIGNYWNIKHVEYAINLTSIDTGIISRFPSKINGS